MKIMSFIKRIKDDFSYEEFLTLEWNHFRIFHSKFILYRNKSRKKRKVKIVADNLSETKKTYMYSIVYAWKNGYYDDYFMEYCKNHYWKQ